MRTSTQLHGPRVTLARVVVAVAALAFAVPSSVPIASRADGPVHQEVTFVARPVVAYLSCDVPPPVALGGYCFRIPTARSTVASITVRDVTGLTVAGWWSIVGSPLSRPLAEGPLCGSVANIAVPSGARELHVTLGWVAAPETCGTYYQGVYGTIAVQLA